MPDLTATSILTGKIARNVQKARKLTTEAAAAMGELAAERVIQNGVRRQLDEIEKHFDDLDDLFPALLQQARESYGDAPREEATATEATGEAAQEAEA